MANTKQFLSHLLQNTGITPACSEEERAAADVIAKIFTDHGFTPEMQEFSASGMAKVTQAILGIALAVGAVLAGIGGAIGIVGLLLTLAAAVLFVLERTERPVLSSIGSGGLSQNVVAYHRASGPLASPRNRPVVVVAHYDSPREDLMARAPFATYKPLMVKLLPFAMVAPAALSIIRMLPVPGSAKVILWVLAVLAALIPLANAVAIIANRFVLPYTSGAVSNKSSVAAMLGVMDAVSPYELGDEFPRDIPADEFFAEQQRILEEAIAAAEAAAAEAAAADAQGGYPHELEGEDDVEGEAADDPAMDPGLGLEAIEGTSGDLPAVDLGSTAMIPADAEDSIGDDAPEDDAPEDDAPEGIEGTCALDIHAGEALPDGGATVANMPPADGSPDHDELGDASDGQDAAAGDVREDSSPATQTELDLHSTSSENEPPFQLNSAGNIRFGSDVICGLGMLPSTCKVVYALDSQIDEEQDGALEGAGEEDRPRVAEGHDETQVDAAAFDEPATEDEPGAARVAEDEALIARVADEAGLTSTMDDDASVAADEHEVAADQIDADASAPMHEGLAREPEVHCEPESEEHLDDSVLDEGEPSLASKAPAGSSCDEDAPFDSTVIFESPLNDGAPASGDLSGTVAMPEKPMETVESLMAQINPPIAQRQRKIDVPSTDAAPAPRVPQSANRASLFDLPDPSASPLDPFAADDPAAPSASASHEEPSDDGQGASTAIDSPAPAPATMQEDVFETISAPVPIKEKPRRGLARFFGRKKADEDSMSGWLGVDDSFDAKFSGADIGSWENFDDGWKGGAAARADATEEELREAIANMGDDELLGHDIWFVATGASESGNAGIRAFLDEHREKLRGVFLINLESVGAGEPVMLATEGEERVLKGDKRIMKLVQQVSSDFHRECAAVDMPYVTTDAHVAMGMSLRSLTIGGTEGTGFALSHTEEDQPYNVNLDNVAFVSDVVTEVIRRS